MGTKTFILIGTDNKNGFPKIKGLTQSVTSATHFLNDEKAKDSRCVELWEINNTSNMEIESPIAIWLMGETVQ